MNLANAIKLLATNVDYDLSNWSCDYSEVDDLLEEASLVVQAAFDFDTNKVKTELLAGKLKKYKKPAREVNVKMRGI